MHDKRAAVATMADGKGSIRFINGKFVHGVVDDDDDDAHADEGDGKRKAEGDGDGAILTRPVRALGENTNFICLIAAMQGRTQYCACAHAPTTLRKQILNRWPNELFLRFRREQQKGEHGWGGGG